MDRCIKSFPSAVDSLSLPAGLLTNEERSPPHNNFSLPSSYQICRTILKTKTRASLKLVVRCSFGLLVASTVAQGRGEHSRPRLGYRGYLNATPPSSPRGLIVRGRTATRKHFSHTDLSASSRTLALTLKKTG